MSDATIERRLREAFDDVRSSVVEHPDLFARVQRTIEEAELRRRFRIRLGLAIAGFVLANAVLALVLSDRHEGSITMPWWVIELITNIILVALAIALGPFIKRFGRAYAADVFRSNPHTGKSYLVLTDVAYYLIFTAFILFTITFVEPSDWSAVGNQLKHEVAHVGGILLIMGILHAANVVALPIIGRLLTTPHRQNRPRDQRPRSRPRRWAPAPGCCASSMRRRGPNRRRRPERTSRPPHGDETTTMLSRPALVPDPSLARGSPCRVPARRHVCAQSRSSRRSPSSGVHDTTTSLVASALGR